MSLTYANSGVDYVLMDSFKRLAQQAAQETARHLRRFGLSDVPWSRGESAYLMEYRDFYLAHVEEGLGTKNLVADAMHTLTGRSYYDVLAQDTVGMIVNDLLVLGALPVSVAMHLAVGSSSWFGDEQRVQDLIHGWKAACELAQCAWGGGETPTLKDIINSASVVLSGSAVGCISPKYRLIMPRLQSGDAIVLFASSGIHANGLTLARTIADKLPEGYLTRLPNGQTYGDALLVPTHIYASLMEYCLAYGMELHRPLVHYAVHITGHGWRKLMRAEEPFVYVIDEVGEVPPLFTFMQEHGPIGDEEAYATFNMGAGFALFAPEAAVQSYLALAKSHGFKAWRAGHIEKRGNEKKVVIVPKEIEYPAASLNIR